MEITGVIKYHVCVGIMVKGIWEVINNPHHLLKDCFLNILCGSITDKSLVIFHVKSFFSISNLLK